MTKRVQRPRRLNALRQALDTEVARPMGTLTKKPLEQATHSDIQALFHPHSLRGIPAGYPLSHIQHEYAKLPITSISNFVDIPRVTQIVRTTPGVTALLARHPQLEKSFEQSIWRAVRERGIKSSKFWAKAPKKYIDWIVSTAKGNPNPMNATVGKIVASAWGKKVQPRTILDIGTFAGGTAFGSIQSLSPEQKRQTNMVLVDVAGNVVKNHAVPKLIEAGIPRENITVIPGSFFYAAVAFGFMPKPFHERGLPGFAKRFLALQGKVDAVIAGAATINFANDIDPVLQSAKRLLKPRGLFIDWEWGSAETRSPTVNIRQLKNEVIAAKKGVPVTAFDAYVSFLNFWMNSFQYPENVKQKLFEDIERSEQFNFFSWCEQYAGWMETEREKTGQSPLPAPAGYRNRAYREGKEMVTAAQKHGFRVKRPLFPLAKPGIKDTGNVNWLVMAQKQ